MSADERKWRRVAAAGAVALVLVAASLWTLNATALPRELARRAAALVSERTGWSVEIGRARFVGLTRLLIEDVDIGGPGNVHGSAPRAYVAVNPFSLLGFGDLGAGWGRVDLVAPHFVIPGDVLELWRAGADRVGADKAQGRGGSEAPRPARQEADGRAVEINVIRGTVEERREPGTAGLWRAEGEFSVRLDGPARLVPRRLGMELRAGDVTISAKESGEGPGSIQWKASGPTDLLLPLVGGLPWGVTGRAIAEGVLDLETGSGSFSVDISQGDVVWKAQDAAGRVEFDAAKLEVAHAGGEYAVRRLELVRGEAFALGEGWVRPGTAGESPELEISVTAKGLALPRDVPQVASLGLSGNAEFSGVLSGTLADPEISGRLKLSQGTVWGRPVDRGEGVILLRKGLFRFGKTELARGGATYGLQGEWNAASSSTTIRLSSTSGDAGEMLRAAGIDLDVSGEVDGEFLIEIGANGPRVEGQGKARRAAALGHPFDSVSGRFSWSPEHTRLDDLRLRLGEGEATASGEIAGGELGLAVSAERWPVPELPGATHDVSGWLSFSGTVSGSLADPVAQGALRAGALQVGNWSIDQPAGNVSVSRDAIRLAELRARGAGDGAYVLSGEILSWSEEPVLDLDIAVQGASLSGLLHEAGLRLPALLFDGEVSGRIALSGPAESPLADFDLSLGDDLGVGDPMRLKFQVEGGRIKLGRLADLFRRAG